METKWLRNCGGANGANARVAMAGPRSDPANANVDDVGHRLAERAAHAALAHVGGEAQHLFPHPDDLGHHVLAVDENRLAIEIAQGGVQDGALLGGVDLLAGEHRLTLGFDLGGLGELDKRAEMGPSMRCFE